MSLDAIETPVLEAFCNLRTDAEHVNELRALDAPTGNPPQGIPLLGSIPVELRERPQWVSWKFVPRDGKQTKCPVDPKTGGEASSTDPSTWAAFDQAVNHWRSSPALAGVGFVFTAEDEFTGID